MKYQQDLATPKNQKSIFKPNPVPYYVKIPLYQVNISLCHIEMTQSPETEGRF
jgi:hypothetical protein